MKRGRIVIFVCALILAGCEKRSTQPIGGGYSVEAISKPNYLMEPGGASLHIVYHRDGKDVTISEAPGGFDDSIYRQITWRLYGANLVFVDHAQGSSMCHLKIYSVKDDKVIMLEPRLGDFWKVIADDKGIIAHRYQNGDEKDDPHPLIFSAEHLAGL